jgi:hypothetical protein
VNLSSTDDRITATSDDHRRGYVCDDHRRNYICRDPVNVRGHDASGAN